MTNLRFQLKNLACFAVFATMMFSACSDDDDDDDDKGNGRTLTAVERELVGKYAYGSSGGGYWTYYSYNFDQRKGVFTYAHGINFKSDGTYESFSFASGASLYRGGSLIRATAKWSIPEQGTVRFADMVENVQFGDGTTTVWRQSENPGWNPNYSYSLEERNGKTGVVWYDNFYAKE